MAERIPQMTDDERAVLPDVAPGAGALRCPEFIRTERGWERCHRDEQAVDS